MYMYVLAWAPIENLICLYHTNLSDHKLDRDAFEEQIRAKAHGFEMHRYGIAWDRLPVAGQLWKA